MQQPEEEDAPPKKAGGSVLDRCAASVAAAAVSGAVHESRAPGGPVPHARCWLWTARRQYAGAVLQRKARAAPGALRAELRKCISAGSREDRHLLDLAGRGTQASAGIREARPEDDL